VFAETAASEIDAFLGKDQTRLFVWKDEAEDDDVDGGGEEVRQEHKLQAATSQLPKRHAGALAFLKSATTGGENNSNNGGGSTSTPYKLNCMTLDHEQLNTLQMFTRECFLPAISFLEGEILDNLANKVRELDVALAASSRSARLPHIELTVHDTILAAAGKKKTDKVDWDELGLRGRLDDDEFLNTIQAGVSHWITQIRKITVLPAKPSPVTDASYEVAFWSQLAAELDSIQEQLKSPGVEITLAMLRETKRFVATLALENNTGLEQAVNMTTDITTFIKGFPLQSLQAARDFDTVEQAVNAIFDHLSKIRQSRYYSLERSADLLSATTLVLRDSMLSILKEKSNALLFVDYKEYESKIRFPALNVFAVFDDKLDTWKDFFADHARRRKLTGMNKVLEKLQFHHVSLKDRLEQIHEFRHQQEAIQQVEQAPRQIFGAINVLDLSPTGCSALDLALEEYDLQMDAMEERLARLLRDKLQACQVCEVFLV
jgi:Dynein heavy chain, N-terminal region 1